MTKLKWYVHDDGDEADEFGADMVKGTDVPLDDAVAFLELKPFYEVEFEIDYDPEAKRFTVVGCDVIGREVDV